MATRNLSISKDTLLALTGSTNLGGGNDDHLPVGYYSTYRFRAALKFTLDWTGVVQITSALLYLKTTSVFHTTFGSDPDVYIERITGANFTENSGRSSGDSPAGGGWNGNVSDYADVVSTSTNRVTWDVSPLTQDTWVTVDVSPLLEDWAPTTVKKRDGSPGANLSNYGMLLKPVVEADGTESIEFYSRKSAYDPYIVLTYSTNSAPSAPTNVKLDAKASGSDLVGSDNNYTLSFTGNDPDAGDVLQKYDYQIDTTSNNLVEPDWAALTADVANATAGITGQSVSTTITHTLTRGQWYAMRVRTYDDDLAVGPWSTTYWFRINSLPTIGTKTPGASALAYIHNLATDLVTWTSAGSHAKARVQFVYNDAGGQSSSAYRVKLYNDNVGAKGTELWDSTKTSKVATPGTTITVDTAQALVLGTQYWWAVEVWDSLDESSGAVDSAAATQFKVRWGQTIYEQNPGAGTSAWQFSNATPTNGYAGFLFRSATGAAGAGAGAWKTTIGAVTVSAWVNFLVRLAPNVAGTNVTLANMTYTYIGSATTPDRWATTGGPTIALDPSVRRFGSQSLLVTTAAATCKVYPYTNATTDMVVVQPSVQYSLSAFVKTDGVIATGIRLALYDADGVAILTDGLTGAAIVSATTTDTSSYTDGWQRLSVTFICPAETAARPAIEYLGTTASQRFWIDAVQMEVGPVVSPWKPGFVGDALTIDSNGLQVDAFAGGIFRLRGSGGATRDTVELAGRGLLFGGATAKQQIYAETYASKETLIVHDAAAGIGGAILLTAVGGSTVAAQGRYGIRVTGDTGYRVRLTNSVNDSDASPGIVLGSGAVDDARIFRSTAAGSVFVDAAGSANDTTFRVQGTAGQRAFSGVLIVGDAASRIGMYGDATKVGIEMGPGSAARDVHFYRMADKQVRLDTDGAATGLERIHLQGRTSLGTLISPTALTANANDWNPTGLATASIIRATSDATVRTITGIIAGNAGDLLILTNANASTAITLAHESASSAAANRFFCPGNVDVSLTSRSTVWLIYDNASSRWRVSG